MHDGFKPRRAAAQAQASAGSAGALAYRARAKRLTRDDQVRNSIADIQLAWIQVFGIGRNRHFPYTLIKKDVEQHFMLRPPHCASRQSVAVHEAAHFLIAHVEALAPWSAKIYKRGHEWGGEMRAWKTPCPADPLWNYANVLVAGPIAQELLGDGDGDGDGDSSGKATDNIEEMFYALFILQRMAELHECGPIRLWQRTLYETAQCVELLTAEILDLAEILSRRKTIWASDPAVRRILQHVDTRAKEFLQPLSPRCQEILASIHGC
jgi:hypothetical protein